MNKFWLLQWLDLGHEASSAEKGWDLLGIRWENLRFSPFTSNNPLLREDEVIDEVSLKAMTNNSAIEIAGLISGMLSGTDGDKPLLSIMDLKDLNAMNKQIQDSFIKGQTAKSTDAGLEKFRRGLKV